MELQIKNFEQSLANTQFDKWHVFDPGQNSWEYSFRARNKPHSQSHYHDCVAVQVIIAKQSETDKYWVSIQYRNYTNVIAKYLLTKDEIKDKVKFFTKIIEQIDKHEATLKQ